ncbi:Uncharacterised protein [Salmonella enterica subsp. arizonae]|uniref:Uncharacterized protein n=1 Tax=Salmonella enterica subsp. arizonae TaxID=59203 RepID=A0A379SUQ3_SALER|nr:Uncharacterised protein [Salmonella enterica subsp. arizonae]
MRQKAGYPAVYSIPICWSCYAFISATAVTPDYASPYPYDCCLSLDLAKAGAFNWGRTGLLGLKAGKLSNNRESLTVSLGCYEGAAMFCVTAR